MVAVSLYVYFVFVFVLGCCSLRFASFSIIPFGVFNEWGIQYGLLGRLPSLVRVVKPLLFLITPGMPAYLPA